MIEVKVTFSATELAEVAGVSCSYIARLCRIGKIPAEKVGNAVWVIQRVDALAWLEKIDAIVV